MPLLKRARKLDRRPTSHMQSNGTKAFFSKTSAKEASPIVQTSGQLYDR